jgi:hypothetical protein
MLEAAGARRLAFLGDYLGRGESDRCAALIRQVAEVAVVGNRDLDWQDRVASETRAWVFALPRTARVGPLLLAHGDARLTASLSTAQIGRDFVRAYAECERLDAWVWAFGHSHHARTWRKPSLGERAEQLVGPTVELETGFRYFLNVGTTGLPFPGRGAPSIALIDFERAMLRHLVLESEQ